MSTIEETFFEDPLYVYIALGLLELVFLSGWHYTRSGTWGRLAVIPILLAGATFAVSRMVVTERERIIIAAEEIADDLTTGRTEAVEKYLHENFTSRRWPDRARALSAARRAIEDYGVSRVKVFRIKVEVSDGRAKSAAGTVIEYDTRFGAGKSALDWRINWIRTDSGWKILEVTDVTSASPLPLDDNAP